MTLLQSKCEPCNHWVPLLTSEQISEFRKQLSIDWEVIDNKKLKREISCKNFLAAVDLINQIAKVAEEEGHHPNLYLHDYKKLDIELYTHKINGLHQNDFVLAAKIEALLTQ